MQHFVDVYNVWCYMDWPKSAKVNEKAVGKKAFWQYKLTLLACQTQEPQEMVCYYGSPKCSVLNKYGIIK